MANNILFTKSGGGVDTGGFRLNYDKLTPLRSVDVGGPDQEQRYASLTSHKIYAHQYYAIERLADFVTKSIENTGNDFTVQDAMKQLGLNRWLSSSICRNRVHLLTCIFSKRDIIPGLEVRLLNHQCIGVAWYCPSYSLLIVN